MEILIESLRPFFGNAGDKELLTLLVVDGLPCQEIGATLKIPVGTVRSRMFRMRQALKQALQDAGFDPEVSNWWDLIYSQENARSGTNPPVTVPFRTTPGLTIHDLAEMIKAESSYFPPA